MMLSLERRARKPSLLAFLGGLLAATAVGLSAYAAHGVGEGNGQAQLNTAALYAFEHGAALAALAPRVDRSLGRLSLYLLLLGTLLFSGSLVGGVLWQWSTRFAPVGGSMLMAGWLLFALNSLRR